MTTSESETNQTHEDHAEELPGAVNAPAVAPSRPIRRPQIGDTRPAPAVPVVANPTPTPTPTAVAPVAPLGARGPAGPGPDAAVRSTVADAPVAEGGDEESPGGGRRSRSRRRSGRERKSKQ